jgi:hypothetical protein
MNFYDVILIISPVNESRHTAAVSQSISFVNCHEFSANAIVHGVLLQVHDADSVHTDKEIRRFIYLD